MVINKKVLKKNYKTINISEDSTIFDIPVVQIGKGKLKIAIINGLHGEETAGAYILKLLENKITNNNITLTLIPFSNITSCIANTRKTPEDQEDLNRLFPGNPNGTISYQIAYKLAEFLREYDFVIDIHTFPKMQMPFVGVYFNIGKEKQKKQTKKLLLSLAPDYIWKLDTSKGETNKAGSLVEFLINCGKLSFAIEIPDIEIISNYQVKRVTENIANIINNFPQTQIAKRNIPVIERSAISSKSPGIFEPLVKVSQNVEVGQTIGNVIKINNLETEPIKSHVKGPAVFVLSKTFVLPGQRVVIIGKNTKI